MPSPQTREDFLTFYRSQNPQSTATDQDIINDYAQQAQQRGLLDNYPELKNAYLDQKVADAPGVGSEFWSAIKSGVDRGQAKLYDVAALAGDATGIDSLKDWGNEGSDRNEQQAAEGYTPTVSKFEDIRNPKEFAYWLSGFAGSQIPVLGATVGAGALAGALAPEEVIGAGAVGLAGGAVRVGQALGLGAGEGLATQSVARAATEAILMGTQSQNYGELKREGAEDAVPLAVANGLIGSAMGTVGPAALIHKLTGAAVPAGTVKATESLLNFVPAPVMHVALNAAKEGSTQMLLGIAQEGANIMSEIIGNRNNKDFKLDDSTIQSRLVNAGIGGFITGGGLTAAFKGLEAAQSARSPETAAVSESPTPPVAARASLEPEIPAPSQPINVPQPVSEEPVQAPVTPQASVEPEVQAPLIDAQTHGALVEAGLHPDEAATYSPAEAQQYLDQHQSSQQDAQIEAAAQAQQVRQQQMSEQAKLVAAQARARASELRSQQSYEEQYNRQAMQAARKMKSIAPDVGRVLESSEATPAPAIATNVLVKPDVAPIKAPVEDVLKPTDLPRVIAPSAEIAKPAPVEQAQPEISETPKPQLSNPFETNTLLGLRTKESPTDLLTLRETVQSSRERGESERTTRNAAIIKDADGQIYTVPVFANRNGDVRFLLREKLTRSQALQKIADEVNSHVGRADSPVTKQVSPRNVAAVLEENRVRTNDTTAARDALIHQVAEKQQFGSKTPHDVSGQELMDSKPGSELLGYAKFKQPLAGGPRVLTGSLPELAQTLRGARERAGSEFNEGFGRANVEAQNRVSLDGPAGELTPDTNTAAPGRTDVTPPTAAPQTDAVMSQISPGNSPLTISPGHTQVAPVEMRLQLSDHGIEELAGTFSEKKLNALIATPDSQLVSALRSEFTEYLNSSQRREFNSLPPSEQAKAIRAGLHEVLSYGKTGINLRKASPDDYRLPAKVADDQFNKVVRTAAALGIDVGITDVNGKSAAKLFQTEGGATSIDPSNRTVVLTLQNVLKPTQQGLLSALHEILHDQIKQLPDYLQVALHDTIERLPLGERAYYKNPLADERVRSGDNPANLKRAELADEQMVEHLTLKGIDKTTAEGLVQSFWRLAKEHFYRAALYIQKLYLGEENTGGRLAAAFADNMVAQIRGGDVLNLKGFAEQLGFKPTYGRIARLVTDGENVRVERVDPRTGGIVYPKSSDLTPSAVRYNIEHPIAQAKEELFRSGLIAKAESEKLLAEALGADVVFTKKTGKPFTEAKLGDDINAVNWSTIPIDSLAGDTITKVKPDKMRLGVALLTNRLSTHNPSMIETPQGKVRLLEHQGDNMYKFAPDTAENAGNINRVFHWITGHGATDRVFRPDRVQWVMRVPDTLRDPAVIYDNGQSLVYLRRYEGGTTHAVVVNKNRAGQQYVETQFPLTETERTGNIVYKKTWPESVGPSPTQPAAEDSGTNGVVPSQTGVGVSNESLVRQRQAPSTGTTRDEIKLRAEEARTNAITASRIDVAKANQMAGTYDRLFARAKEQYPDIEYDDFMRAHGAGLDPKLSKQESLDTLSAQLEAEYGVKPDQPSFDSSIKIDQLAHNERGLAEYELVKEVNRHLTRITRSLEDGRQRELVLDARAEQDRQVVREIDKNLLDIKTTDATARNYIRGYLGDLKRDIRTLDKASYGLGEVDATLAQLEPNIKREALANTYNEKLIDSIDVNGLGLSSAMKALFKLEDVRGLSLAEATPQEIRQAVKDEVLTNPNSALTPLVRVGNGPQADIKGTALLASFITFIKRRAHVAEVMRAQLDGSAESRASLLELHKVLSETNETKLKDIQTMVSKDLRKPGNRLIYNFLKKRDQALSELRELDRLKQNNDLLSVSQKVVNDLKSRAEQRLGVSSSFALVPGALIPDPKSATEPSEVISGTMHTLKMGRDQFTKSEELRQILRRQSEWLEHRADKPELQDSVYHSVADAHEKLKIAAGSDEINATLSGLQSGYHDNIGEMLKRTGTRSGATAQRMWVKFSEVMRAMHVADNTAGKKWERSRELFMHTTKLSADAAHELFYRPMAFFMQTHPGVSEEEAFVHLERQFRADPVKAELLGNPSAWSQFVSWAKETKSNNVRRTQASLHYGNKVRDEALQQENIFTGKESASLRNPLERGVTGYTISQKLHRDISALITTVKSRLQLMGDGDRNPFMDTGLKLRNNKENLRAALNEVMTPEVRSQFLDPLILNSHNSTLPAPARTDGLQLRVPIEVAAHSWSDAKGDLLKFAENVYRSLGTDGSGAALENYTEKVLNWVHDTYAGLDREVNPPAEQMGSSPRGVAHVAMDARVADNYPPEWLDYNQFSAEDNRGASHLIAANSAFGRNFDDLYSQYAGIHQELSGLAKELGGTPEIRSERKRANSKEWYTLRANAEEMLHKVEQLPDITRRIFDPTRGGMDDIGLASELHGGVVTGMLVGLKSAVKNLLSPTDTIAVERSLSSKSLQTVGRGYAAAGKYFLNAMTRVFGADILKNDRYARLIEDAGGFDKANAVDMKDLMSGTRGRHNHFDNSATGKIQRAVRIARNVVTDTKLGVGGDGTGVAPRLFNQFQFTQLLSNYAITDALLKRYEEFALRGADYYAGNPERVGTTLTAKNTGYSDAAGFDSLKAEAELHGFTLEDLAEKAMKRRAANAEIFDKETVQKVMNLALDRVVGESSPTNRPSYLLTSRFARTNAALVGWNFFKTAQVMRLLRDEHGNRDLSSLVQGAKLMALGLVPASLAFSYMLDQYDEKVTGKKSNLRELSSDHIFDTILERTVAMGSFGILGDAVDTINNVKDGAGQKLLSVDQRIVWLNSVLGMAHAVADLQAMGGFENANYANFWRRVAQAGGGGGVLQFVQMANHLFSPDLPLFKDEASVTDRINVSNYLRAAGRELGLEVRTSGGGSTPTPMTPWITNMALAALSNDREEFQKAYAGAIKAAQSMGKSDPRSAVAESYATRNPIKAVFRTAPSQVEYTAILNSLPAAGRQAVIQGTNLFNQYGIGLGVTPYTGAAGVSTRSLTAARPNPANIDAIRSALAARRFEGSDL